MTDIADKIAKWRSLVQDWSDETEIAWVTDDTTTRLASALREAADEAEHADLAWRMAMRRIAKLEAALRWYADEANYRYPTYGQPLIDEDRGDLARQALAEP